MTERPATRPPFGGPPPQQGQGAGGPPPPPQTKAAALAEGGYKGGPGYNAYEPQGQVTPVKSQQQGGGPAPGTPGFVPTLPPGFVRGIVIEHTDIVVVLLFFIYKVLFLHTFCLNFCGFTSRMLN